MSLLMALALLTQDKIVFKAAKDSKPEELKETAKAIHARISEYGYKEILVWEGIDKITLESPISFEASMRPKLEQFALKRASSVEIRFVYPMTPAEAEQFKPLVGAPKGAVWENTSVGWIPFRDAPILKVSKMVTWKPSTGIQSVTAGPFNENQAHLAWNEAATKQLLEYKDMIPKCRLFLDGEYVDARVNITWTKPTMKWTLGNPEGWDVTGVCLNHPLSIQLTK